MPAPVAAPADVVLLAVGAGSYDPLHAIADVCEKHKVFMHVDASWGGGALVSQRHKHLLDGASRADSVRARTMSAYCRGVVVFQIALTPHKQLGLPIQCSVLLTKERGLLQQA